MHNSKSDEINLIMGLIIGLFAIVSSLGAFDGGVWAIVAIAGGPLVYGLTALQQRHWPVVSQATIFFTGVTLALLAVMNLFSFRPLVSWQEEARLASIFIPLSLFPGATAISRPLLRRCFPFLIAMTITGVLSLAVELYLNGVLLHAVKGAKSALSEYNRGLSYVIVLAFALIACAQKFSSKKVGGISHIAILLVVVLLIATGLTESRAAKLAFIVGLTTVVAARFFPIMTKRVLGVLPVVLCLWPFVIQHLFITCFSSMQHLPDSWRARVEIWDYMSYRILEKPWLGYGLGTSGLLPTTAPRSDAYIFTLNAAPHPHNVVTQLWVELGLAGLLLGLGFAWLTLWKIGRLDNSLQPYARGAWVAALCLCLVAYNFWTDSLFGCFILTGYMFALLSARKIRNNKDSSWP